MLSLPNVPDATKISVSNFRKMGVKNSDHYSNAADRAVAGDVYYDGRKAVVFLPTGILGEQNAEDRVIIKVQWPEDEAQPWSRLVSTVGGFPWSVRTTYGMDASGNFARFMVASPSLNFYSSEGALLNRGAVSRTAAAAGGAQTSFRGAVQLHLHGATLLLSYVGGVLPDNHALPRTCAPVPEDFSIHELMALALRPLPDLAARRALALLPFADYSKAAAFASFRRAGFWVAFCDVWTVQKQSWEYAAGCFNQNTVERKRVSFGEERKHEAFVRRDTFSENVFKQDKNSMAVYCNSPDAPLVVLDIESHHGGLADWADIEREAGGPFETLTVRTGTGGLHVYFKGASAASLPTFLRVPLIRPFSDGCRAIAIDVRAGHSFVFAPGSRYTTLGGAVRSYKIFRNTEPVAFPPQLAEALRRRLARPRSAGDSSEEYME